MKTITLDYQTYEIELELQYDAGHEAASNDVLARLENKEHLYKFLNTQLDEKKEGHQFLIRFQKALKLIQSDSYMEGFEAGKIRNNERLNNEVTI